MADIDMNQQTFAAGLQTPQSGGSGGGQGGAPAVNSGVTGQDVGRIAHNLSSVPIGLPVNLGSVFGHDGMDQGLKRGAVTDGNIPSLFTSGLAMTAGFLAPVVNYLSELLKSGNKIEDQTTGVGGNVLANNGSEGGSSSSGSESSGSNHSFESFAALAGMEAIMGKFGFDYMPASRASLGNIAPPSSFGASTGEGFAMGV